MAMVCSALPCLHPDIDKYSMKHKFYFCDWETENGIGLDGSGIKLRQIHGWVRTKPNTTPVPIFDPQPDSELIATAWLLVPLMICWQVTWWDGGLGTSTRVHMNVSTSTRNTFTVTPATQMERCFILWVLILNIKMEHAQMTLKNKT